MARSRASAKQAGTRFETETANYLAAHVDDRIERRARTGALDRGDIGGVRHLGQRIVIECKSVAKYSLSQWAAEAEQERVNDTATAGVVVHKRHGKGDPADQWVTMTLGEFVALINGNRNHYK